MAVCGYHIPTDICRGVFLTDGSGGHLKPLAYWEPSSEQIGSVVDRSVDGPTGDPTCGLMSGQKGVFPVVGCDLTMRSQRRRVAKLVRRLAGDIVSFFFR